MYQFKTIGEQFIDSLDTIKIPYARYRHPDDLGDIEYTDVELTVSLNGYDWVLITFEAAVKMVSEPQQGDWSTPPFGAEYDQDYNNFKVEYYREGFEEGIDITEEVRDKVEPLIRFDYEYL